MFIQQEINYLHRCNKYCCFVNVFYDRAKLQVIVRTYVVIDTPDVFCITCSYVFCDYPNETQADWRNELKAVLGCVSSVPYRIHIGVRVTVRIVD